MSGIAITSSPALRPLAKAQKAGKNAFAQLQHSAKLATFGLEKFKVNCQKLQVVC